MRNYFVGAYNFKASRNLPSDLATKAKSLQSREEKGSTLIENNSFFFYSSNENAGYSFSDNLIIGTIEQITGYSIKIPSEYAGNTIYTLKYLYSTFGLDFAKYINGHFVIVLLDWLKDQLLLIQDKLPGIKTLYWHKDEDSIYFSNYIKPLLIMKPGLKKIDQNALFHYLRKAYVPAPYTIFEGISQLTAGELLKIEREKTSNIIYDPWKFSHEKRNNKEDALEEYENLLTRAIRTYQDSYPQGGYFLSGGYDSSINVALASRKSPEPLLTFGIAASKYNTDAVYAKQVAEFLGTKHSEYWIHGPEINDLPRIVWQMENPYYDPGVMLTHCCSNLAGQQVNAMLGGELCDQLFGGCAPLAHTRHSLDQKSMGLYKYFHAAIHTALELKGIRNNVVLKKIENKVFSSYDVNFWIGGYGFRECDLVQILKNNLNHSDGLDNLDVPDDKLEDLFEFCCTEILKPYSLYSILTKSGRMADLHGIEIFSPYLDKDVFNCILSLDHSMRTPMISEEPLAYESKFLHKELGKKLFPPNFFERSKQGGAVNPNIHLDYNDNLLLIKNKLLKSPVIDDLFKINYIERLFEISQKTSVYIMMLLVLDLWHYLYIESSEYSKPQFTLDDYLRNNN